MDWNHMYFSRNDINKQLWKHVGMLNFDHEWREEASSAVEQDIKINKSSPLAHSPRPYWWWLLVGDLCLQVQGQKWAVKQYFLARKSKSRGGYGNNLKLTDFQPVILRFCWHPWFFFCFERRAARGDDSNSCCNYFFGPASKILPESL